MACPPDKNAIRKTQGTKLGWNALPFFGPSIAEVASRYPTDASDQLSDVQGKLQGNTTAMETALSKAEATEEAIVSQFMAGLDDHVNALIALQDEPIKETTIQNSVSIFFLSIVIFMLLTRKGN